MFCVCRSKDELDHEIQQSSCKMDYCRLHEENLVRSYHSQVRFDTNQWNGKIQALELDIEKEGQRSERVEKQLCVTIEVNYRYLLYGLHTGALF